MFIIKTPTSLSHKNACGYIQGLADNPREVSPLKNFNSTSFFTMQGYSHSLPSRLIDTSSGDKDAGISFGGPSYSPSQRASEKSEKETSHNLDEQIITE
jgi:hypothetical protein